MVFQYIREVREELDKVVWPTRREVMVYTVTVIVFSVAVSIVLGAADFGLVKLFQYILSR